MKKVLIYIISIMIICNITIANAVSDYENKSIDTFINSPSLSEIETIKDKKTRVCERVFLEAFMRRDFTENENKLCSDIFEQKIEAQLNYMKYVMGKRGIY